MSDVDVAAAACPNCGEAVVTGDAFCEACGHSLTDAAPAAAPPVAPVATLGDGEADANMMAKGLAAAAVARATARSAAAAGRDDKPTPVAEPAPTLAAGMGAPDPGSEGVACQSCGATGQWFDGFCGMCGTKRPDPRDHTEREGPGLAAVSDKGLRHAKNEDSYGVAAGDGFVVAVVCDGVSTTVVPEVASQAAADAAVAVLAAGGPSKPDFDGAFDAARAAVAAVAVQPHPDLGPPACTYLAAVITDASYRLSAFGDCRGYWVQPDGTVQQLTVDDSWATDQIALGMPAAEVYADNRAHAITRWLGQDADPSWRPVAIEFPPPGPGRALLVSDGVWNYAAEPDQLSDVIRAAPPPPLELARHLVTFANGQGGADNITAVVVDLPLLPRAPEAP
ncbi:MAG: protein phosphatase 2C domain-containing protein [Acidimicrobiales bacterium]